MLYNYLKVAWRNLWKHKNFSIINIAGLALSMSVCLILINLILDHYQYDQFHEKKDQIFRITSSQKGNSSLFGSEYATSPIPFGKTLKENLPEIESYCMMNHGLRGELHSEDRIIQTKGLYAQATFFDLFGFDLLQGNPASALQEPNSIVLSKSQASLLFPDTETMGQTVTFGDNEYIVTGIIDPEQYRSHIQFEALASYNSLEVNQNSFSDDDWRNLWSTYNYLLLQEGAEVEYVTAEINRLGEEFIKLDEDHAGYSFRLQNIASVVPGNLLNNEIAFAIPWFVLVFFAFLGVIVILAATINYANLSIAKSLDRAKEIGIRKVNGAKRSQIIKQFLFESVMIALISLFLAVILYRYLLGEFNALWIFNEVNLSLEDSSTNYYFFLAFSIFLGLLTGLTPALALSRISSLDAMKGKITRSIGGRKQRLKNFFIGIQYGFSVLVLISLFLIRDQANFLTNSKFGFNDEHVFYVELQNNDWQKFRNDFSTVAGTDRIAFTSHHPAVGRSHADGVWREGMTDDITLYHFAVDHQYLDVMEIELLEGRFFTMEEENLERESYIVINEKAVDALGFESNADAVNQTVRLAGQENVQIIGVVKDYHWEPLMQSIQPLALRTLTDTYQYAYFNVNPAVDREFRNKLAEKWSTFDSGREFRGGFLDAELDQFYQFFYDLGSILTLIGVLAIFITSIGFLGIIGYELKSRRKEMGIRKVLGATFSQIAFHLSRGFLLTLSITFLIAIPISIWINSAWITLMDNYDPISVVDVSPAILLVVIVSLLTIILQVRKNMQENPVEALRDE